MIPLQFYPPKYDIFEKLSAINTSPIEIIEHCGLALIANPLWCPLYKVFNTIFEIGHFSFFLGLGFHFIKCLIPYLKLGIFLFFRLKI